MKILHRCFQYTPLTLPDFIDLVSFYDLCKTFCRQLFKMKLLINICTVLFRILINAHVSIYSIADLNIGHYVQLTLFEGKLGRCLW